MKTSQSGRFFIGTSRIQTSRRWFPIPITLSGCRKTHLARRLPREASADQASIAAALQTAIAVQCVQEPAPKPLWKSKPTWYLVAEEDRMINPKPQHFMAQRMGTKVRAHRVDHTPMYSDPIVVVDVILEAARENLFC
jgi:pimeloyl-ACP methyl ester carboxylesterase